MFDVTQSPDDHKDYVEHFYASVFDFLILLHQIIVLYHNET